MRRGTDADLSVAAWRWSLDAGSDGAIVLRLSGHWGMQDRVPSRAAIAQELGRRPDARVLAFETGGIDAWDSRFVVFVRQVLEAARERQLAEDLTGLPPGVRKLLEPHDRIAVYLEIDPRRGPKSTPRIRTQKELQPAIDKGLRAQLRIVSFVTGQLSVSLDFQPHMPVVLTGLDGRVPEVPTVPTQLAQYQARLERMLDALDKVDLGQLAQDVGSMVRGIDGVARSPELAHAVRNAGEAFRSADVTLRRTETEVAAVGGRAGAALDAARELVRKVDREVEPLAASVGTAFDDAGRLVRHVDREIEPVAESLRTALDATRDLVRKVDGEIDPVVVDLRQALHSTRTAGESAQEALARIARILDGETRLGDDLSQALHQLTGAARSVNALAAYLERHPEALLRGKDAL